MTGVKISELPTASVANSTDQFEVNQAGTSRRVTLSQIVSAVPAVSTTTLDVRDYGVTMNGVTDDTAAATAAVAAAVASKQTLYWPYGTALTTASIPLLHTVQQRGPGDIKRGTDLFAVEALDADTNKLYVAPAGVSTNDGLSSAQPTTPQAAANALVNYGPTLGGTWEIKFAAGSHSSIALSADLVGDIRLLGVPTGDYRSVPTSVIDKALSGASKNGIYYSGDKRVLVKDIKVINFSASGDVGFRAQQKTISTYENCHSDNCAVAVYQLDYAQHTHVGGIHDGGWNGGTGNGIYGLDELYCAVRSFRAAGSRTNRTTFRNFQFGVHSKELCTGHMDYAQITDCDYGIEWTRGCGGNLADMDFRRNGVGVVLVRAEAVNNSDITWNGQRVLSAAWAAGQVTITADVDELGRGPGVAVGDRFDITDASPAGWNGSYVALVGTTDTTLIAALAVDPGAWVSGGRVDANIIQILPMDPMVIDNQGRNGNIEFDTLPPYLGQTSRLRSTFTVPFALTGTTALSQIFYPMTGFFAGQFQAVGYEVSLYATGTYTIANPATLFFRAGSFTLHSYVLTAGTAKPWVMEARFIITATGNFQHHSGMLAVDGLPVQVKRGTTTLSLSTIEYNYGVWGQLTNAADTITGEVGRLWTTNM